MSIVFGGFQAIMPLIGYFVGSGFYNLIKNYFGFVSFVILAVLGGKMIYESFKSDDDIQSGIITLKELLILGIATSIDALAIGVSFAFTDFEPDWFVYIAFILIGVITFTLSSIGVKIGNIFGTKYKSKAEFAGGFILILLGLKILLEGLGILK